MVNKELSVYFRDWENEALGFGYGTGEPYILKALQKFLSLCNHTMHGSYDYKIIEKEIGAATTWLLINLLCHQDMISYGSSPRGGFLTEEGNRLKEFVCDHTVEELYDFLFIESESGSRELALCYKTGCNCGPNGFIQGINCANPFWKGRVK